jgi:hypothetical protein
MKDFIEIKPEFSLDKDLDNASPTAKVNLFSVLRNYIPEHGGIITRRGITSFESDTAGGSVGYDLTIEAYSTYHSESVTARITLNDTATDNFTPHTFSAMTGSTKIGLPSATSHGRMDTIIFVNWDSDPPSPDSAEITVTAGGTHVGYYTISPT